MTFRWFRHLGLALLCAGAAADTARAQTPLRLGSEFVVNTYTTGDQGGFFGSAVAQRGDGFVVVWEGSVAGDSSYGIAGRRFGASGAPIGSEFRVNTTTTFEQRDPAVSSAPDGSFVVVWKDENDGLGDIFGQRYDASGAPAGSEFVVNTFTTGLQGYPDIASRADGSFLVTWWGYPPGTGSVMGRRFASDGTALGPQFTLTTAQRLYPAAAATADGNFVVVWVKEVAPVVDIAGQRYDASGAPIGGEFAVSSYTSGYQTDPVVTASADGGFVVVWQSTQGDGDGNGVFGQRFTSAGSPAGPEFVVNTYTTGSQFSPAVASVLDGGFVVVWSSDGDVVGQRYDATGSPLGGEFLVKSSGLVPAVAPEAGGGFVVTYRTSDGSSDGVGGQRYVLERQPGTVVGTQKISDLVGNFGGTLADGDEFGDAVTGLGDLDGDGVTDLAVGASFDDDGGPSTGAVWVLFLNADGTVKAEQKISQLAGGFGGALDDGDRFGFGVAALGDLDGDGVRDLAVGAHGDDDGGFGRGAVWVLFLNADGTVRTEQKISDLAGGFGGVLANGESFGYAVATLGDLDGDGVTDLAVGAIVDGDGCGLACGAVWVLFLNADGTVKAEQKISATAGGFGGTLDPGDVFGTGVAALGDLDGDGIRDLAVGAAGDGDGGANRGAVWILFLNADGTVQAGQKISQTAGGFAGTLGDADNFGTALAALGDLDGDGAPDLAVGAPNGEDGGSNRGSVWVLFLNADGTVKAQQKISDVLGGFPGGLDDGDRFGSAVTALGDLDGDGETDLAVGAPEDDDGGAERGAVWVLFHNGTPVVELNVTYTEPEIVSGPLSFGLAALPPSVTTTFRFVTPSWPPPLGAALTPTVLAASSTYGDARWTTADLQSFSVTFGAGDIITALTYAFRPIDTSSALDGISQNDFELHVSGTDRATKEPFEYRHARSAEEPTQVAATPCPPAPDPGCVTGFTGGLLSIDERTAGAEKVLVKWTGGPALAGTDFGNPLAASGTSYRLCVYDDGGTLAGRYVVDRAGYLCGTKPCWKALGPPPGDPAHKGYKYKDAAVGADGVLLVRMKGGGAGQTKALVRAKNLPGTPAALPTGVASKLAGASGATVQLLGTGAPECVSATLPTVVLDEGDRFKAKN